MRRSGRLDAVTGLLGDSYLLARHAGIRGGLRLLAGYLAALPDWLLALVMVAGILGSADILSASRR